MMNIFDKSTFLSRQLGDMFAGEGIMRNSLLFQIPRLITMRCSTFFGSFQHLSMKLTSEWYCKVILDSEKEQFSR